MLATITNGSTTTAERIIYGGLFVQIGFFSIFIIVGTIFQYKISREPSLEAQTTRYRPTKLQNWQTILVALFVCSVLIQARCIVRTIEYIQGWDGYIISHEVFIYTLDLLLMFFNMIILCWQDVCVYFLKVGPITRNDISKEMLMFDEEEYTGDA